MVKSSLYDFAEEGRNRGNSREGKFKGFVTRSCRTGELENSLRKWLIENANSLTCDLTCTFGLLIFRIIVWINSALIPSSCLVSVFCLKASLTPLLKAWPTWKKSTSSDTRLGATAPYPPLSWPGRRWMVETRGQEMKGPTAGLNSLQIYTVTRLPGATPSIFQWRRPTRQAAVYGLM